MAQEAREARKAQEFRKAWEAREALEARKAGKAREALEAWEAREAWEAQEALDIARCSSLFTDFFWCLFHRSVLGIFLFGLYCGLPFLLFYLFVLLSFSQFPLYQL